MDIATAEDSESDDPEQSKMVRNPFYCLPSAGTESDTQVAIESSADTPSEPEPEVDRYKTHVSPEWVSSDATLHEEDKPNEGES